MPMRMPRHSGAGAWVSYEGEIWPEHWPMAGSASTEYTEGGSNEDLNLEQYIADYEGWICVILRSVEELRVVERMMNTFEIGNVKRTEAGGGERVWADLRYVGGFRSAGATENDEWLSRRLGQVLTRWGRNEGSSDG